MPSVQPGATPTEINLTSDVLTTPDGAEQVKWQASASYADPNNPQAQVRDVAGFVARVGGAVIKTADYLLLASDCGRLMVMNSGADHTFTLPAVIPTMTAGTWHVFLANMGAGDLTIARNGKHIDGASVDLTLTQGQGVYLTTDGTHYYTEQGVGTGGGGGGGGGSFVNATRVPSEVPGGTVNGTDGTDGNDTFTLLNAPVLVAGVPDLQLFKNGQRMTEGVGFSLTGSTITFASGYIPVSGDDLIADYSYASTTRVPGEAPSGTINGTDGTDGNDTFTLSFAPVLIGGVPDLQLFKNGQRMTEGVAFNLSSLTITFVSGYIPISGDDLFAIYSY
jgi:hypothetical protein